MSDTFTLQPEQLDERRFHESKANLVNKKGIHYTDFKKTLIPVYSRVWMEISAGWVCLLLIILAGIFVQKKVETVWIQILLDLILAKMLGLNVNYLLNFFHEASHFNLTKSKEKNDLLANIFLGILHGHGIKHYRIVHWQHHVHLGTTEDPERSYFEALTFKFILESLTGIRAIRIFLFRHKNVQQQDDNKNTPEVKRESKIMFMAGILFHAAIIVSFFCLHFYGLILIWGLGIGTFFPFYGSLRQLLEHRSENASKNINYAKVPHGKLSRMFNNSFIDRIFGSAGFNRHLLHHFEPQISYTNLKQVEEFLLETSIGELLKKEKTSYPTTFIHLLGK